jgi:hypothetical protein
MTKNDWVTKFALALHDKHGRPLKLAFAIASSSYAQRSNVDPQLAASARCADRELEQKASTPAKPKRAARP